MAELAASSTKENAAPPRAAAAMTLDKARLATPGAFAEPPPPDFLDRVKALTRELGTQQRLSWDEYFGGMALLAAARSPCGRLHVGCVVVRDRRVLSMGYNGFFQGAPHRSIMAHGHEQATVHAEQNAISHAARTGISLDGADAYVTHYPCVNCFKTLVSAGIRKVYYIDDYRNDPVTAQLSDVANVPVEKLKGQTPGAGPC
mmetsp:Transcript_9223/g.28813  ORF Transcript_9223/g.28813 Transcript_9223/m.28813 type:complete len:202 (-) Transcript_9223:24-629(-)